MKINLIVLWNGWLTFFQFLAVIIIFVTVLRYLAVYSFIRMSDFKEMCWWTYRNVVLKNTPCRLAIKDFHKQNVFIIFQLLQVKSMGKEYLFYHKKDNHTIYSPALAHTHIHVYVSLYIRMSNFSVPLDSSVFYFYFFFIVCTWLESWLQLILERSYLMWNSGFFSFHHVSWPASTMFHNCDFDTLTISFV